MEIKIMKNREILVSPSLLSADKRRLESEVESCKNAGADWLHYDIIDGHFAPNITFGADFVKALSDKGLFNDVHLMIEDPCKYAKKFIDSGADLITFHYEAVEDCLKACERIRGMSEKIKVGISIKPRTSVEEVLPYLNYFDLILVMSVEPGFSGQAFIPSSLDKIRILRKYIDENNLNTLIEVDGGINQDTCQDVVKAGADVLVTGSFFFSSLYRPGAIKMLKGK